MTVWSVVRTRQRSHGSGGQDPLERLLDDLSLISCFIINYFSMSYYMLLFFYYFCRSFACFVGYTGRLALWHHLQNPSNEASWDGRTVQAGTLPHSLNVFLYWDVILTSISFRCKV